ncbi:HET-domain-containing protein [Xylaria telfairii]|nr:HET-domain-containing protein [Xylaria telfairii]
MRLINTRSLDLEEFVGREIPGYAILSHTWQDEEVTFKVWQKNRGSAVKTTGYNKIVAACHQAREDNLDYLWVDTNCIDKRSSAELSEAINSMYAWYRNSKRCYVYLADFIRSECSHLKATPDHTISPSPFVGMEQLHRSKWFTRGWTLQELLAPETVIFFDRNWQQIGNKRTPAFRKKICEITGIDNEYLSEPCRIPAACVSEKMSWLSLRTTTRVEDLAYCMLGIFEINMPLLYGEGDRAFLRLQEEIIRISNDQTIFCWHMESDRGSVLAPHPSAFRNGAQYKWILRYSDTDTDYSLTNRGLLITLPAIRIDNVYILVRLIGVQKDDDAVVLLLESSAHKLYCRHPSYSPRQVPEIVTSHFVSHPFRLNHRGMEGWISWTRFFPNVEPSLILLADEFTRIKRVFYNEGEGNFSCALGKLDSGHHEFLNYTLDGALNYLFLDVYSTLNNSAFRIAIVGRLREDRTIAWQVQKVLPQDPNHAEDIDGGVKLEANGRGSSDYHPLPLPFRLSSERYNLPLTDTTEGDRFALACISAVRLGDDLRIRFLGTYESRLRIPLYWGTGIPVRDLGSNELHNT